MDSFERLREEQWAHDAKAAALRTSLVFRPIGQLLLERDCGEMKQTSETLGLRHYIAFARGRFDNFAAPVIRCDADGNPSQVAYARDEYYFSRLCLLAIVHGRERVYRDCQRVYAMATDAISPEVYFELDRMSREYEDDEGVFFNTMLHVYYGMVAEEHYQRRWEGVPQVQRTQVGKLMKMHAIHRMLVEGDPVGAAATECVSMSPDRILAQAAEMGLTRTVTWVPYATPYDDPNTLPEVPSGLKKGV